MEPILVYGVPEGSSMGLIAALEWLGKPYALTRVDMLSEMREPSYALINARHETPALVAPSGGVITETMAIAAWMEARDTARKISFDPHTPEADHMHMLMGFINTGFTSAFSALWTALEMESPDPAYRSALQKFGRESVLERYDKLEAMIGAAPFLCGDSPTLADALFIGVARWLDYHDVAPRTRWPKIDRLRQRLEADVAVRAALAVEGGDLTSVRYATRHLRLSELIERLST